VAGRYGMVCSGHPRASQAGMALLPWGGTAADGALAVAAAPGVVGTDSDEAIRATTL
jgi:gamma-glutamyltranspeptidase